MPCTSSDAGTRRHHRAPVRRANDRRALAAALCLGLLPAACTWVDAPRHPRPPLPVPPAVAARFATPAPLQLQRLLAASEGVLDGDLLAGDDLVRFHWHRADLPERPLVLLVPILAGGDDLMRTLARRFVDRGYQAIYCDRAGPALRPPQRGPELEALFERTVQQQRAMLAWTRTPGAAAAGLRPGRRFACGVSMGGMITAALMAVEPDLDGAAMCLAGADLPAIVLDSAERRIEQWRAWRCAEDGLSGPPLLQELQRHLRSDPLLLARHVPTPKVLLVSTRFDDVVRPPRQDLLWEAMGRPCRFSLPLGHYSAALALDAIVGEIARFFADRGASAVAAP